MVSIAASTDTGRARKHNEDYVGYHVPHEPDMLQACGALMVVCDGVGGAAAGEVASEEAVHRILKDYYEAPREDTVEDRLLLAIEAANDAIYFRNTRSQAGREMGTTVVAAAWLAEHLVVAHAGDSRAYLVRDGEIAQLTRDHSWVADMVRSGDLTPEEAERHPWRSRITRGLGLAGDVNAEVQSFVTAPGDILILCSDGLTRHVEDGEIADIVMNYAGARAVRRLVDLANLRGGKDNISAIVAEWLPEELARERRQQGLLDEAETDIPTSIGRSKRGLQLPSLLALIAIVVGTVTLLGAIAILNRNNEPDETPAATTTVSQTALPIAVQPSSRSVDELLIHVGNTALNLRAGPSDRDEFLGLLQSGDVLTATGWLEASATESNCPSDFWLRVETSAGSSGWVCADYVLLSGRPAGNEELLLASGLLELPIPSPTASPTSTSAPSPASTATLTTTLTMSPPATNAPQPTFTPTSSPTLSSRFADSRATSAAQQEVTGVYRAPSGPALTPLATIVVSGRIPLAVSSDLERIAATVSEGNPNKVVISSPAQGSKPSPWEQPFPAKIRSLAFSANEEQIAVGLSDGTIWVYSIIAEERLLGFAKTDSPVTTLAYAPGQPERLVAGLDNGRLQEWLISRDPVFVSDLDNRGAVVDLSTAAGLRLYAVARKDGSVQVWRNDQDAPSLEQDFQLANAISVALSPDGTLVAIGSKQGQVKLWDIAAGLGNNPPNESGAPITGLVFSADGALLAAGMENGKVRVWWLSGDIWQPLEIVSDTDCPIAEIAFSSDNQRLAAVTDDGFVQMWKVVKSNGKW